MVLWYLLTKPIIEAANLARLECLYARHAREGYCTDLPGGPGTFVFYSQKINKLRLAVTYDFIKEFPMLYVEPITRKEITEYTAMEEQVWGKPMWQEKSVKLGP